MHCGMALIILLFHRDGKCTEESTSAYGNVAVLGQKQQIAGYLNTLEWLVHSFTVISEVNICYTVMC